MQLRLQTKSVCAALRLCAFSFFALSSKKIKLLKVIEAVNCAALLICRMFPNVCFHIVK